MEEGDTPLLESGGVRVAVEGCGHGTLNAIYSTVQNAAQTRGWDGVDLLIIGGDFQAVRNAADLTVMSVPAKYRELGDFPAYYSGQAKAPILTIFIGGNHEASSHLWELYYGGWVAPNIYYLGAANVLRFGPIRIAGMSGIWKGFDYNKPHYERLPFSRDDVKSFYHVREVDVRKLLLIREQVDVGLSHDWPRAIERHGDEKNLWRMKPDFKQESFDGTLGSPAASYVLDRLRPAYWFSAHLHCKFSAVKRFETPKADGQENEVITNDGPAISHPPAETGNPDEIDLDMDDDDDSTAAATTHTSVVVPETTTVPDELRAQLPASFSRPSQAPQGIPGQPVPQTIQNLETRFLALDKALPGRKFVQLCYIKPIAPLVEKMSGSAKALRLEYDPEWLAITRLFHPKLSFGDRTAKNPANEGEFVYSELINKERSWVEENIVAKDRLTVPDNFTITAPPLKPGEGVQDAVAQPLEYTNPQTSAFCELLELRNVWDATPEEREARLAQGPPPEELRSDHRGGRGPRGGGRGGFGRGGPRGRGRGRGRGFRR